MLARNLENSPSAEEIPDIAAVLAADLCEDGMSHVGSDRVVRALNQLGRELTRWPCTAQVLEKLRKMPNNQVLQIARYPAGKDVTPEEARENIRKIRLMLNGIGQP